jgi:enoyl-CoA hydratase/long-chain 3-hydroxyacyl-CoA dehydrogenase
VFLKDKDAASVGRGEAMIMKSYDAKLKKKRMTNHKYCDTSSRLVPLHDGSQSWTKHFSKADMVIEAVFEDINVKHAVIQNLESVVSDGCIIATNTSAKMPLLEIITHDKTSPEVAAAAMEVGTKQKKNAIFVKDVPGFYVNRCLAPFSAEASALISEGCNIELMDKAMMDFGMPVGPITLCDEVGIDVSSKVGKFMAGADLGARMDGGNMDVFEQMCEADMMGRKSGKGFYLYPAKAAKGAKKQINPEMLKILQQTIPNANSVNVDKEEIQRRLIAKFINEAAYCLQDGIIRAPADGDIGAVMGIGFPPFLGGPFRMLDSTGTQNMVDTMYKFRDLHGDRFEPCQLLKDYAASGKKFFN